MKYAEQLYTLLFVVVFGSGVCLACYGMMKGADKLAARGNYEKHRSQIVTVKDNGSGKIGLSKTKR